MAPNSIAQDLKEVLKIADKEGIINRIEVVNGFLNLYLNKEFHIKWLLCGIKKEDFLM